jgi:hypothetical protein
MPLYFGLPVKFKEAFRLFDLDFEKIQKEIMKEHNLTENMYKDCYFVDYLNKFFITDKITIKIFYMSKGMCIIGYKIQEVNIFEKQFINVNDFIIKLTDLKTLFSLETMKYKNNFSKVILEHMEDEPETVSFPEPYIIEYVK